MKLIGVALLVVGVVSVNRLLLNPGTPAEIGAVRLSSDVGLFSLADSGDVSCETAATSSISLFLSLMVHRTKASAITRKASSPCPPRLSERPRAPATSSTFGVFASNCNAAITARRSLGLLLIADFSSSSSALSCSVFIGYCLLLGELDGGMLVERDASQVRNHSDAKTEIETTMLFSIRRLISCNRGLLGVSGGRCAGERDLYVHEEYKCEYFCLLQTDIQLFFCHNVCHCRFRNYSMTQTDAINPCSGLKAYTVCCIIQSSACSNIVPNTIQSSR